LLCVSLRLTNALRLGRTLRLAWATNGMAKSDPSLAISAVKPTESVSARRWVTPWKTDAKSGKATGCPPTGGLSDALLPQSSKWPDARKLCTPPSTYSCLAENDRKAESCWRAVHAEQPTPCRTTPLAVPWTNGTRIQSPPLPGVAQRSQWPAFVPTQPQH
jgi:hypothetical protein